MYKNFNLTESEREQILSMHKEHGYKKPLNEETNQGTNPDVSCLVKAGFKKEQIGGPMTRRLVYTTVVDGMNYQYDTMGGVRVFNDTQHKVGTWTCDPSSPKGIKIIGLKDKPVMPF